MFYVSTTLLTGFFFLSFTQATKDTISEPKDTSTLLKPEEVRNLSDIEKTDVVESNLDERNEEIRNRDGNGEKVTLSPDESEEKIRDHNYSDTSNFSSYRPPKLDVGRLESFDDSEYDEDRPSEIDSYSLFMRDYFAISYVVKCMTMMIHHGGYLLDAMTFGEIKDDDSPIKFTAKMDRFPYPTYAEVFGGMYTNYTMISAILSLKACSIYYQSLDENVAAECQRYSKYLRKFQEVHPVDELFKKNPLMNDKMTVPSKYTATDVLEKLLETIATLSSTLEQNFTPLLQELQKIRSDEGTKEEVFNNFFELPEYKPRKDLDRIYTQLWEMLLKPIEENMIVFHNYFNDAMNINHFINTIEDFPVLTSKSRPILTMAWNDLANSNYKLEDTDFVNMIFHILRSVEFSRLTASIPFKEKHTASSSENLYTLVDTAFPRNEEPRESNFLVVI